MHIITINERRGHEFEREQGKVYGRIWKEVREEKYYNYINLKYSKE